MIQKIKDIVHAYAGMLAANAVALTLLALVVDRWIRFECVTPPASTLSLAVFILLVLQVVWRLFNEPIKDLATAGSKLAQLRQAIDASFDDQELDTLCFDLGIDYDNLPAVGKAGKARELIAYLYRRKRIADLVAMCSKVRPAQDWNAIVYSSAREDGADQGDATGFASVTRSLGAINSLSDILQPRPTALPDQWLWASVVFSGAIVAALFWLRLAPFRPVEPTPLIEGFSVRYIDVGRPEISLRQGDLMIITVGEQAEIRAVLRGSAGKLCAWSAQKISPQPGEGCSTLYSAPPGVAFDVLTVRVQSLCKTRETYGGLSVAVQTR